MKQGIKAVDKGVNGLLAFVAIVMLRAARKTAWK